MKKFIFPTFIVLALFTLLTISCKSTPEPAEIPAEIPVEEAVEETKEPVQETEPIVEQETEPAPQKEESAKEPASQTPPEALTSVQEARQRVIDFEGNSYFPSEWETAEAKFNTAADLPEDSLNSLAAEYDEIFSKAIPLYEQAREDEILAARDEALSTGFQEVFPDFFKNADDLSLQALDQYEAEDFYSAKDTASSALSEYQLLTSGGKVNLARQEVIDRGFIEFDQENFEKAEVTATAAIEMYENGDKQNARTNADEALAAYNLVLLNGWVTYADEKHIAASTEKELALADRVNIAAKDAFREADAIYNKADTEFKNKKFDSAATLFVDAEARFVLARKETAEKRERAQQAIKQAEDTIEASNETAADAERTIEGVSK